MEEPLDYASSGVDIEKEGAAIARLVDSLRDSERVSGEFGAPVDLPGGFGGVVEFGNSCLALATDGVGSKIQIANEIGQLGGIGIDCVAMNVNDLICLGAEPLAFVDYIAVPEVDLEVHATLGSSLSEGCSRARVTLAGGETATLPGIVKELDVSGTAMGWFPKDHGITGQRLEEGDCLIGLPSSGLHSNGFSLVRAVIERTDCSLDSECPFDPTHESRSIERFQEICPNITLGEVLLNPTRIYVRPIIDLIFSSREEGGICPSNSIKGIAHITGGGLSNLLRLHDSLGWHIGSPLSAQPEFQWIAESGGISDLEMHRTFNMGMGMIIAVSAEFGDSICDWLNTRIHGSKIVGEVTSNGRVVTHLNPEIVFKKY